MNSQEFVTAVERYVRDAAIEDTITNLQIPPGRKPDLKATSVSNWYNGLTAQEKDQVRSIITGAVHAALFGLFTVIDGSRTIDDGSGHFEIAYITGEQKSLLNPPSINLHELLNSD